MATHSSILAWKIPWTEEPGGLQSVRHDLATTQRIEYHALHMEKHMRHLHGGVW